MIFFLTPGVFVKGGISRYCRYQIQALKEHFGGENIRVFSLRKHGISPFEFENDFEVGVDAHCAKVFKVFPS